MATPEGIILKAICDYLTLQERLGRCVFWRQNNTPTYDKRRGCYRAANGPGYKYGVADIVVALRGGFIACIEVKSDKGHLSDRQKDFKGTVEAVGGRYIVARSVNDIERLFGEVL